MAGFSPSSVRASRKFESANFYQVFLQGTAYFARQVTFPVMDISAASPGIFPHEVAIPEIVSFSDLSMEILESQGGDDFRALKGMLKDVVSMIGKEDVWFANQLVRVETLDRRTGQELYSNEIRGFLFNVDISKSYDDNSLQTYTVTFKVNQVDGFPLNYYLQRA